MVESVVWSSSSALGLRCVGGRCAVDVVGLGRGGGYVRDGLTDVAVVGSDGLAVLAQAVGDEIDGHGVRRVAVSDDVERTGQNVAAVLDGLSGGLDAADGDSLDVIAQRAKADVTDSGLIVGDGGHDAVGAGLDGGGLGGVIDLLAVGVLLLDTGQLDEGAAGAGEEAAAVDAAVLSAGAEEAAAESAEPQAARLRASAAAVTAAIAEVRFMCVFSLFPKFMWYSLDVLLVLHRKQANCTAVLRRFRP